MHVHIQCYFVPWSSHLRWRFMIPRQNVLSYSHGFATLHSYLRRWRSAYLLKLERWGYYLLLWDQTTTLVVGVCKRTCKFLLQVTSNKIITFNFCSIHSSWFSISFHFLWYQWAPKYLHYKLWKLKPSKCLQLHNVHLKTEQAHTMKINYLY
jgi:hypothetical protein